MKCQNCGGPSADTFCCIDCEERGVVALYHTYAFSDASNMKLQIRCTTLMANNKQLCNRCSQRLKRLITGRCNGVYERAEEEVQTND